MNPRRAVRPKTEPCAGCRAPVTVNRFTQRTRGGRPYCGRCAAVPLAAGGYFKANPYATRKRTDRTERAERGDRRTAPQDTMRRSSVAIDRMAREDEDRLRTALHEAAHVVVARLLGAQLEECRVAPTGGGETRFTTTDPADLGIVLAAGAAAELLFFGDVRGAGDDERRAAELLTPAERAEAASLAEAAVRTNRPLILALAQRLRSRREVDGPELEVMVDEVAGQRRAALENRSSAPWVEGPNGPEPPYAAALRRAPVERTYDFRQTG